MAYAFRLLPLFACIYASGMVVAQDRTDCTCRHQGLDYELGEKVCLSGISGPTIARCEMVLNNTSWKFTSTPCSKISLDGFNNQSERNFNNIATNDTPNTFHISPVAVLE